MMKTPLFYRWTVPLLLLLTACGSSNTTFEVIRIPQLQANIDGERWEADRVEFQYLGKVVYYSNPADPQGEVFERINILAFESGSDLLQLKVSLDVKDREELVGNYSTTYEEYGGLHDIQWLERGESGDSEILSYSLCGGGTSDAEFVIQRQQRTEELVAGIFRATLCERTNTNDQVELADGEFRDLEYGEE